MRLYGKLDLSKHRNLGSELNGTANFIAITTVVGVNLLVFKRFVTHTKVVLNDAFV